MFYPHYRNALTIYNNSEISFTDKGSTVLPKADKDFEIIYTGIHLQSRTGKILAPFDKIGVVFQALGINHFIDEPLSKIMPKSPKSDFNYFGNTFHEHLDNVYNTSDLDEKVTLLDAFFESQCHPFEEQRLLHAVTFMFKEEMSIFKISEALKISRKTLLRLFQKHLNCSPKDFSNLVKFRKAIEIYQESKPSLTDLAYLNDYYDQSDFIKHFKKVTGFNPKKFFCNLSHLGTEDTFWTLLKTK